MIIRLACHHNKKIAGFLLSIFYLSLLVPIVGFTHPVHSMGFRNSAINRYFLNKEFTSTNKVKSFFFGRNDNNIEPLLPVLQSKELLRETKGEFIGGPSQPEMSSFKSAGADNLVNLFTGDFSYNLPLMDVGGYPINIYYDAGISPEQEASWVGLGWNINPGNINRNTRGIPDDFNGEDTLEQVQIIKPNKTWGVSIGSDFELLGIKLPAKAELGVAFNNYLGPALDLGLRGNAAYKITNIAGSEKISASSNLSVGVDINSRTGTSFSANASLLSTASKNNTSASFGVGLATAYNSRSGLKALNISEQHSFNVQETKAKLNKESGKFEPKHVVHSMMTGTNLFSSSISFLKPSYTSALRMTLTNTAWSGHFQLGFGINGTNVDLEGELYGQKSEVDPSDIVQRKPMVGYFHYQNALNKPDYIMDYTRFNDREVTPNTPVISVPQYTYDVFSIQGEGTGGSIRAFRNDLGYVRDNLTISKEKNFSVGADIGPPGHYGANLNVINTPSSIGEWNKGNKLRNAIPFTFSKDTYENIYFRNPGEGTVVDESRLNDLGGIDLVRFVLGGTNASPTIEPRLQAFNNSLKANTSIIDLNGKSLNTVRNKRTQVISFLSAVEASKAGLDIDIKSYNNKTFIGSSFDTLQYEVISRIGGIRKPHHISQINVTESNGKRYVYGIPVYNIKQKDFTFSVDNSYANIPEKVLVRTDSLHSLNSSLLKEDSDRDGYVQITTTPPNAHSFLLSGILSTDYVDVTGNGITEDDLGTSVKFNYTLIKNGTNQAHKWRTPFSNNDSASFSPGNLSEIKDDKAIISYGERESWYLHSIESKNMIALFYVSDRLDGKGVLSENGGVNISENLIKKLDSIALYNKSDIKARHFAQASPIKTVHFRYSYILCKNTPDNISPNYDSTGKLTLDSIFTTFNGKTRALKNKYVFHYKSGQNDNQADNPDYSPAATDRWGTYKPKHLNPNGLNNAEYPYSIQSSESLAAIHQNAGSWLLKQILLPSGGQIEVNYESDDYAFVQNRRAAVMMKVVGFGNSPAFNTSNDRLYSYGNAEDTEKDYVFIRVPEKCSGTADVYNKYLQGMNQLAFKIFVEMPKGYENVPCYASFNEYGVDNNDSSVIWLKLNRINGRNPISITTLEFLRQNLPGQAFEGYDVSGSSNLKQVGEMLGAMLQNLQYALSDPLTTLRSKRKANKVDLSKSFVRLNDPDGYKYGGGHRVKSVILKDNWNKMTGQYTATYGKKYEYTLIENFNGEKRTISSGVASYEPSIGNDENPFQSIIEIEDYLPLGPTSYGAVEMPVLDAFFPAPMVGYSKVTVKSIYSDSASIKKSRSGIGKQVTEFYTAKDFPVYYSYTPFDRESIKEFHQASSLSFFNKYSYDYKALTQGFLVATNDMHGKMKSQSSYPHNDSLTKISYVENFYRNTGANGLNDKFTFIDKNNGGSAFTGNMGIDVELMTDAREFSVKGTSREIQSQVDIFYFLVTVPITTAWGVNGISENIYRAITTTKVVNFHAVLDSSIVIDKGSQVSTKNMAFDANTGEILITRTNNEFDEPVYNTSIPAYWAYGGMGLAYRNIDANYSGINFFNGRITNPGFDSSVFESGDELLIQSAIFPSGGCEEQLATGERAIIWAIDTSRNFTSLKTNPGFVFVDSKGKPYTMNNVSFRIIRSGSRNILDNKITEISSMVNPIATGKLMFDTNSKVINASAVEYKEKWQTDNDVIRKLKLVKNLITCIEEEIEDSTGYLEKSINPYLKGLLGYYLPYRSLVFFDSRKEYDSTSNTNISQNGFLKNFKSYWSYNSNNFLVPDSLSPQWVWNSKLNLVNSKGLELENQDALGIYTAAQYGYNKTLPVTITQNSRFQEMFSENFEDYLFNESINNTKFNFLKRHIDFKQLTNSYLVNTDTVNFRAHTGKFVRAVNAHATALINIPIKSEGSAETFTLKFLKDTTRMLNNPGGNYGFKSTIPLITAPADRGTPTFGTSSFTLQLYPKDSIYSNGNRQHYFSFRDTFYLNVTATGTYNFTVNMSTAYNNNGVTVFSHSHGFNTTIYDESGNLVSDYTLNQNGFQFTSANYSVFLCAGKYKVLGTGTELYYATNSGLNYTTNNYSWSCSNLNSPDYKDLSTENGCEYNKGIGANESMLNPLFSIPNARKMLFSGWVRETCANENISIPCGEPTYNLNQVQLKFPGFSTSDITIKPTGPIIDGWQRYEGDFIAPVGATEMSLGFVNNGTKTMYIDDIRMHPYNANMKSYVYDPVSLRLMAELDANNYGSFYEYDEEGILIRTKIETKEGIKTISETRSFMQKSIQ